MSETVNYEQERKKRRKVKASLKKYNKSYKNYIMMTINEMKWEDGMVTRNHQIIKSSNHQIIKSSNHQIIKS